MPGKLMIIWDYDSALGQLNSSLPYNFDFSHIYKEIELVDFILSTSKERNIIMTFACLGFAAEKSIFPFDIGEQIKKIFNEGHEIASHSWRHEWFPYLTEKQIFKSLERSKYALEKCIGKENIVGGFVPPHSRPMSWYKKYSFSLGDRAFYPFHKGADMGYIIKQLSLINYKWCRVLSSYKPFWEKALDQKNKEEFVFNKWEIHNDIVCVPQHYTGFDGTAQKYLDKAVEKNEALVIISHPAGLDRNGAESSDNFIKFLDKTENYRIKGQLEIYPVSDYIKKYISRGA